MSDLYMMMTITDRIHASEFTEFYAEHKAPVSFISLGKGTASDRILDYLGLEDEQKSVILQLVTGSVWKELKRGLERELRIDVPGTGISFIVPISSIGGKRELQFFTEQQGFEKEVESTLKNTTHELIVVIANYGYNDLVMKAANAGGATGGTVLHARGVGLKRAEKFLGVSLASEKELILIVTRTEQKNAIMQAIMEKAGMDSKAMSIVFSLPVTSTAGLRLLEQEDTSPEA